MKRNGTSHSGDAATPTLSGTTSTADSGIATMEQGTSSKPMYTTPHDERPPQGLMADVARSELMRSSNTAIKRARPHQYHLKGTLAQRLVAAGHAIEAVLSDSLLQEHMAAYGYDHARMLEGQVLYEQALVLQQQQRARGGDQLSATAARDAKRKQAEAIYLPHVATARVALRDQPGADQKLDLGRRATSFAGWLVQAKQFYANALEDEAILTRLAQFRLTVERLRAAQALIEAVEDNSIRQKQQQGTAQATTQMRDDALAALHQWMRDFLAIARIALSDQPQTAEKLGIVVGRS